MIAARLQATQQVVVTARANSSTRAITPEWQTRDIRRGTAYNIRTAVPSDDRLFIELTCESGVMV